MNINVKVKIKSKTKSVEKVLENEYVVRVSVPPVDGKANSQVIEMLSDYFNIPKQNITLIKGLKSKNKVFNIDLT